MLLPAQQKKKAVVIWIFCGLCISVFENQLTYTFTDLCITYAQNFIVNGDNKCVLSYKVLLYPRFDMIIYLNWNWSLCYIDIVNTMTMQIFIKADLCKKGTRWES